jgi:hypothetical protein
MSMCKREHPLGWMTRTFLRARPYTLPLFRPAREPSHGRACWPGGIASAGEDPGVYDFKPLEELMPSFQNLVWESWNAGLL